MTTTVTVEVPENANYQAIVTAYVGDKQYEEIVLPGKKLVTHVYEGRDIFVEETSLPITG